jgi:pyruvate formate lyase activating enzyme
MKPAPARVCLSCHQSAAPVSKALGYCKGCLRGSLSVLQPRLDAVHAGSRNEFGLPTTPPRHPQGVRCGLCSNECRIGEGERGYCGLRTVQGGRLVHLAGTPARGLVEWYRDPLPTNCVADWICEGSRQQGNHNLAVFYASCTANCLFCQNWHFREVSPFDHKMLSSAQLAGLANSRTFCVCYFGGDPASQMPHALSVSQALAKRGVRVCWETNGTMYPKLLDAAVQYSLDTGGCIKFDLKAFDEDLNVALTSVSNQRTLENFARAAGRFNERPQPPLLVASTLLVPGYVDQDQVKKIAQFIASLNPKIPYTLLAFAPHFYMSDLPCTSASEAQEAAVTARAAGLCHVRVGNQHLLRADKPW